MGDHTEAISIDFDPEVISYNELLAYFWKGHRCDSNNSRRQYMNAVFYRNEEQRQQAEQALKNQATLLGISEDRVATKIWPVKTFTYAEMYHQKYAIKGKIRSALNQLYPDAKAMADSTVATRINAYLGYGMNKNKQQFLAELPEYGLPEKVEAAVRKVVAR